MPIDPLKVLSEQLRESPGAIPDPEGIEIRLSVEGYSLPEPAEGMGFIRRTPRREPWLAANKPFQSGGTSSGTKYLPVSGLFVQRTRMLLIRFWSKSST